MPRPFHIPLDSRADSPREARSMSLQLVVEKGMECDEDVTGEFTKTFVRRSSK
jgi:hypothetical protein